MNKLKAGPQNKGDKLFNILMLNLVGVAIMLVGFLVIVIIQVGNKDSVSTEPQAITQSDGSGGQAEPEGRIPPPNEQIQQVKSTVDTADNEKGRLYESHHVRIRFREAQPPSDIEGNSERIEPLPTLPDDDKKM